MPRHRPLLEYTKIGAPMLLLVLAGFALAFVFVEPAPPGHIVLATGEPEGAYALIGERFREALSAYGIEVEIRPTAGSAENLALLRAGDADVAFVQGGVADPSKDISLLALGSLYFEPLWIFQRREVAATLLSDLGGRRVSAGPEGSGTRAIALPLLRANGVTGMPEGLSSSAAAEALRTRQLDVAFLVAAPESPIVRELLAEPAVELLSLERADAYARRFRYLSQLTLPRGVIDLAADVPPDDVSLVSPAATLVVGESFHPALVDLMLQAAARIHGGAELFSQSGDFPTPRFSDLPLSKEAKRYYEIGPPFLQRFLPFWLATLVDRLKVMLIPLVALLIPLFRLFPPVYRWRVRSRIYRWYTELREIDTEKTAGSGAERVQAALREVERIEDEVAKVPAPASYAQELYDLRIHIEFVRTRLRARAREPQQTGS
jgi:TRAP transporter TAXI family solute receptor